MTSTTPVGSGERVLSPVSSRNRPSLRDAGPLPGPPGVPSHAWEIGRPWSRLRGHEAKGVSAPPWPLSQHVMAVPFFEEPCTGCGGAPPKELFRGEKTRRTGFSKAGASGRALEVSGAETHSQTRKTGTPKG